MRLIVLLSLPLYAVTFWVLQSIYANRAGATNANNVNRVEVPGTILMKFLSTVFFILSIGTMQDADLTTWPYVRVVGFAVVALGITVSMTAQRHLGKNWVGGVGLTSGHKLVTDGPYRLVRHPLYSGILISVLGIGLVSLDIVYFLSALCFGLSFLYRVLAEEDLLQKKFKKKYLAYAATTGRVFPKIRKRG